jgi:hypothetical protein
MVGHLSSTNPRSSGCGVLRSGRLGWVASRRTA